MKGLLKRILIPTLASPPISTLGNWLFGQGLPVFMLHRMHADGQPYTGICPDHLRRCLQYLVDRGYHFISLEDVIQSITNNRTLPHKAVAFSMDDGYADQAEIAAPIFIEFNCPATLFVITAFLDNNMWPWDAKVTHIINATRKESFEITLGDEHFHLPLANEHERREARNIIRETIKVMAADTIDHSLGQLALATGTDIPEAPPAYVRPMNWDTARLLETQGIKFAPHTISHRILSKLDAISAEREIIESWQRISEELVSPSPIFCYPNGRLCDYGPREINVLKQAGFIGAVSTTSGSIEIGNTLPDYAYNLPRHSLPTDFDDFIQHCSWIETAKEKVNPQ